MRRNVLSNPGDLDIDARELARAAAWRMDLNLDDWASLLATRDTARRGPPSIKPLRQAGAPFEGSLSPSGAARPLPGRDTDFLDHEAMMAAMAAESERQAYERAVQDHIGFRGPERPEGLVPLTERLDGLRSDVLRLSERLEQADPALRPAVEDIRSEIEVIKHALGGLASRNEIATLEQTVRDIAKAIARDLEQGHSSKDLLTLASAVAALYRQVQNLSEDTSEGTYRRLATELDLIKGKIDKVSETGIDRSVIDFLSSQVVDLRHDLAHRAEPRQIERISGDIATLGEQIADLRANQIGRLDFATLQTSLEDVCSALHHTAALQQASEVPEQLQSLSQRLDILVSRPEPEPIRLDPLTGYFASLSEQVAGLSSSSHEQANALGEMIGRLSSQIQSMADREPASHEPLMERFDRLEEDLRQVGHQADTTTVELMLRSIDEKLERASAQTLAFDALEKQIVTLAGRLTEGSNEPLQRILDDAAAHLKNLQNEAAGIAERAAKAAVRDIQHTLPDTSDLDALKQGFIELKALQSRADKKTQETLRAVHEALETLTARFPDHGPAPQAATTVQASPGASPERLPPADRLEAAVRRLHTATLSQVEDVAGASSGITASESQRAAAMLEPDNLGSVRASFIAAARRAAQTNTVDDRAPVAPPSPAPTLPSRDETSETGPDESPASPRSLIERIRQTFDSHRRPLLFSLGFLILAAGATQVLPSGYAALPKAFQAAAGKAQEAQASGETQPSEPATEIATGSIAPKNTSVFQPSNMASAPLTPALPATFSPAAPPTAKFIVEPTTVGELPAAIPAELRRAAQSGDAAAIFEIASRAAEGRGGIEKDMILAVHLYERAAQAGLPPAQEQLAMLYESGTGVWRDPKQAMAWYERAAQGGNIRAMHSLANLLSSGTVGKPDHAAALRWYGEAAETGFRDSQLSLGILLARGTVGKPDLPNAFKWLALAASQGDPEAVKKRDEVAARLGISETAALNASLEKWRPRAVDPVANEVPSLPTGETVALDRTPGKRS